MTRQILCGVLALLALEIRAGEREVRFERITGEKSGVAACFREWYRVEMERQGGPGKSHGWWPWGLRAFDFDRDNVLDLLASHHGTPHSMLLRGRRAEDGVLQFSDVTKTLGVDHRDLPGADDRPWIWDFDGDGWLDIAGISDESSPSSNWNQQGKKFIATKGSLFRSLSHPREVLDLNGDGYLDVDGGHKGQWFFVPESKTFRHDAKPRFTNPAGLPEDLLAPLQAYQKANRFFRVDLLTHDLVGYDTLGYHPRPIDLDGDGVGDVVAHGSGGYGAQYLGRYLLGQKDGRFLERTEDLGLPLTGAPIFIRDLTGDGRPEVLIVGDKSGSKDGGLYLNDGKGMFRRAEGALSQFLTQRGPYLIRAYETDFDNDGQPDLMLSNPRLGLAAIYHNRGQGQFAEVLKLKNCWDSNPIVLADFDADGRMDLAVGVLPEKDSPGDIHLFLNRTEGVGHHLRILPRMPAPNPFAVGAVVEVFAAGEPKSQSPQLLLSQKAHLDGSPVHVGLGARTACDVRVLFPGSMVIERKNVPVDRPITVSP